MKFLNDLFENVTQFLFHPVVTIKKKDFLGFERVIFEGRPKDAEEFLKNMQLPEESQNIFNSMVSQHTPFSRFNDTNLTIEEDPNM